MRELTEGGARVVVLSHFGRPKGAPDPALSLRPLRFFRLMLRRPELVVGLVPSAPMNEATLETAGSCSTTSASARCRSRMLANVAVSYTSLTLPTIYSV